MFLWITANGSTILICAILLAVVSAILIHLRKNKQTGKSSCGCGCASCPMSASCHQKK